ncbi:hypothetical protein D9Q98_009321 [Chlorella vulgaris]|uniref:Reverse transcriptase domain-containing protein n=1 Tax=Chlorella vulgaris TaxID=3077 RepID=A0A9D4TP82_CHLVU|nr:hypothetical protein D9Q98_009321 [Chlorella vulgaris]
MLQAIQAMYADVPVCVRTEEGLSGCFQSVLGVKQGCPLSPLLFGIFLDDFEGHIQQLGDAAALPQLAGRTVPPLLFADDMFLLSSSASGLQAQLHALQDYCNAKKLTVNAKKTQVMIMRPGGGSGNGKLAAGESFEYAGLPLEVASSTKYLGLTFSQLSKQHGFASCADVLAKAGRQAMFAMRRRAWELGACLVEQQCMLFDVFAGSQGLRARGQAGFRQGYRTVDNCFILRALAERARSRGVKLYLCAVDFEKAFDSVDRPLLWAALQRAGIGGTMLQAIQAMYADVPVCVRTEEGLSGCFQSVLGVKQGCPLSPLLFGIFLDDFEGHIQQLGDAAALPQLAGRTVPPLLFADDMFLLSSSASGLQAQLHALQDYCNAKKLTVNAKKTQVMIMRPGGGSGNGKLAAGESFEYAGLPLEVASSTKYLGLTFSQLSKQHGFASCADVLAKAGRQAMFAMRRRAWELGACLVEQQCMLFDVFVKPVLSYGCELWGVDVLLRPDCSSVERVHRWFCRRVQGLPKQVTAAISLAELGRQPLQSFWIQQLVRFWNRLQNSAADEDRVLGHPRMAH